MKPKPLKSRTMTLAELRKRTLKFIKATRKQIHRQHWEKGPTDDEFVNGILHDLENDIKADIETERMSDSKMTP